MGPSGQSFGSSLIERTGRRASQILTLLALSLGLVACQSELFSKLDEVDANMALTVLYNDGIAAHKTAVDGGLWKVEVATDDYQRALALTTNQGVPRERFASMGDLFKKEGLVSTPSELRMRHLYALSQELANTLAHIDGVIAARVHPVIPVNDPLSTKVQPASAAVFIKHSAGADLQQLAPAIKTLVARSIEGLNEGNVSLTFVVSRGVAVPPRAAGLWAGVQTSDWVMLLVACIALLTGSMGWLLWRQSSMASLPEPEPLARLGGVVGQPDMARLGAPTDSWFQRLQRNLPSGRARAVER